MERTIKPELLQQQLSGMHMIDVRRKADLDASSEQVPGASWRDPEQLEQWAGGLPKDQNVVLYCVHGGSVSNSVVDALHAKGLKACFIEGGIEGWKAAGGEVVHVAAETAATRSSGAIGRFSRDRAAPCGPVLG